MAGDHDPVSQLDRDMARSQNQHGQQDRQGRQQPRNRPRLAGPSSSSLRELAVQERADPQYEHKQNGGGDDDRTQNRHDMFHREHGFPLVQNAGSRLTRRSPRTPGDRASRDTSPRTRPPWAGPRPGAGTAGTRPPGRRESSPVAGSSTASRTQPLRQSLPMPSFRSMIRSIASGVVSMTNRMRTGS